MAKDLENILWFRNKPFKILWFVQYVRFDMISRGRSPRRFLPTQIYFAFFGMRITKLRQDFYQTKPHPEQIPQLQVNPLAS